MGQFFLTGFLLLIGAGVVYKTLIEPKRWMNQYSDGVYNPLRKAYKKAAAKNQAGFTLLELLFAIVGIFAVAAIIIGVIIWAVCSAVG